MRRAETEHAVGDAIERVLSAEWSSQEEDLPRLAQGLFDNEDPWILRHTPLPSPAPNQWPTEELVAFTREADVPKLFERFRYLAANQALPEGWTVAGISAEDPIKQSKSVRARTVVGLIRRRGCPLKPDPIASFLDEIETNFSSSLTFAFFCRSKDFLSVDSRLRGLRLSTHFGSWSCRFWAGAAGARASRVDG